MNLTGKRILITGGTSGIGLELAQAFLARGARLFLVGRRATALEAAITTLARNGGQVGGTTGDVANEADRARLLAEAAGMLGGLDVLVNNAGAVRAGRLEHITEDEIRTMIEVDLIAPILLTRAALPYLRASGDALIINVTSGIALNGVPFYATYAGAKAGLARFSEALRRELGGEGIGVLTVYPVATDTPMMKSSAAGPDIGFAREPAAEVAHDVIDAVETGRLEVIRGGETRARLITLNRDDPAAMDRRFAGLKAALEEATRDHKAL